MANNTIKTRIQLKNDTEAHWDLAVNFIPRQGELIVYSADEAHPFSRLKVGDGTTTVSNLPFIDAGTVNGLTLSTNGTIDLSGYFHYVGILKNDITSANATNATVTLYDDSTYTANEGDIVIWYTNIEEAGQYTENTINVMTDSEVQNYFNISGGE